MTNNFETQDEAATRNPQSTLHTLLIATSNQDKVAEIAAFLDGLPCRVIGLRDLSRQLPPVEETGDTFLENALIKAEYYHAETGLLTLADDSGLLVDALDGRPGVYSARYGGEGWSNAQQIAKLLDELKDVDESRRTARFVCALSLVGSEIRQSFEGKCEGRIAREPRGSGGFGYDPVFIDESSGRTFAEFSLSEKAARSHRGKALAQAREFMEKLLH